MKTIVRVRVELDVDVEFDGSYEFGPGLDNLVLPRVIGAVLEKDGTRLGEVELGDVLVLASWEEETPDEGGDEDHRVCHPEGDCAVCEEYDCDE